MVRRAKKRMGKDAKVSVLSKYLHPSRLITQLLPNVETNHRLENCVVIRLEVKKIRKKDQLAIVLKHDDFKTNDGAFEELHTVSRWCNITEEGPSDLFFDNSDSSNVGASNASGNDAAGTVESEVPAVAEKINNRGLQDGDVVNLQGLVEIDDDNAPAPENIPDTSSNVEDIFTSCGHDGVCQRRQAGGRSNEASIFNFGGHTGVPSILQTFEIMFPKEFLENIIIKQTNKKLEGDKLTKCKYRKNYKIS